MSHRSNTIKLRNSASLVYSKSLLIAIAAFALTASGAHAFSGEALMRAGLTASQRAAFEVARELRLEGDITGARDLLVEAGIDELVIERVRTVLSDAKPTPPRVGNKKLHYAGAQQQSYLSSQLTSAQKLALFAAQSANDRETIEAILEEAGLRPPKSGFGPHTLRDGRLLD
jgi:hypothetical protein